MKGEKLKLIFLLSVAILVLLSVILILGGEKKEKEPENIGDIICDRIKSEIPINDIKVSNDGKLFEIRAMTERERIFLFLEEKLGEAGEKLRILSPLLPEEIRFRCEVKLVFAEGETGVRPVVTNMSLNEYEIPSSVLENIVDFPLISSGF